MTHHLKTWPQFFGPLARGEKTFEMRKEDDRTFDVDDVLVLEEFDPTSQEFSGAECERTVTYVMRGPAFGLAAGWVIMGVKS
jgi:hypothetical protein